MNRLTKRCPICNEILTGYRDITAGTICEDVEQCTSCGYYYEYLYGYTSIIVPPNEFFWNYNTKREDAKPIQDAYQLAVKIAREQRLEKLDYN